MFNEMLKKKAEESNNSLVLLPTFTSKKFNDFFFVQSCVVFVFTVWMWFRSGKRLESTNDSIEYVAAQSLLCLQAYILWVMAHNSDVQQEGVQNTLLAFSFMVLCARRYMVSCCPEGFDPAIAAIA